MKIKFDPCIVDDEQITVIASSTSFISHKYEQLMPPETLIKDFNHLKSEAKIRGFKVLQQNKTVEFIERLQCRYLHDRQKYEGYFAVLKSGFKNITEREFHFTEENKILMSGLTSIRNEMENLFRHDMPMRQFRDIHRAISLYREQIRSNKLKAKRIQIIDNCYL